MRTSVWWRVIGFTADLGRLGSSNELKRAISANRPLVIERSVASGAQLSYEVS